MNSWRDDLYPNMLVHDGQKGMKWGRRRYRNYDGTLTPAGRERYGVGPAAQNAVKKLSRKERRAQKEIKRKASAKAAEKAAKQATEESKRAAEEARQAQEELRKAQEAAAAEAEKKANAAKAGPATAEGNAQLKLEADRAKLNADILRETNNRIKHDQEYRSLVRPKNQTPEKKTTMEKALAFVDTAKKVTAALNDIYKMIEDIKKGFKGESDYDRLKKQSDMDKLKYDMETRDRSRKKWATDDAQAAADKASSEDKAKADRESAARTANQEAADRWAAAQAERSSFDYRSNNRSNSFYTEPWRNRSASSVLALPPGRGEQAVKEYRALPVSSILALPPGSDSGLYRKKG